MTARLDDAVSTLGARYAARGWSFRTTGRGLVARRSDWPRQLEVAIEPARDGADSLLALTIDCRSMPLGGERFKDIFNGEREEIMAGFAPFTLRQQRADGSWLPNVGHGAFLSGFGPAAVLSRQAVMAIFSRPADGELDAVVGRFEADLVRLMESGDGIAAILQRVYQRTVLARDDVATELPEMVGGPTLVTAAIGAAALAPVAVAEPKYPWRR
ncbi:MAG: hypothetical protein ACYDGR_15670 [Candidatus Dormibacteria bacterium]